MRYGWIPDRPDQRDLRYASIKPVAKKLPKATDLRARMPPVYDQGELGSCTANAIGAAFEFTMGKANPGWIMIPPSRLFIYYWERYLEHTVDSDSGAMLRDGIKVVNQRGDCPETLWPYNTAFNRQPNIPANTSAKAHRVNSYHRLDQTLTELKSCLAEGYPFVFGFTVYESFESDEVARTGVMPMPEADESVLGGHAVLAVGYDDAKKSFLVRNSWGGRWGIAGYFWMPYAYLTDDNLSADFWTIRGITAAF